MVESQVLGKRGFNVLAADDKQVAQATYGRVHAATAQLKQACHSPQKPCKEWQRITMQKTWASPNPESMYVGCAAWQWILQYWHTLQGNTRATITDGWATKLFQFGNVYADGNDAQFQVLVDGEWSALVCAVREENGRYRLDGVSKVVGRVIRRR